ncbi:MAG: diguanylate cyclase [Dehalococcoidia bacterium]
MRAAGRGGPSSLIAALRPGDTVARFGGDEFAVLVEDVTAGVARDVAVRVIGDLRRPFHLDDRDVYVSASVGVVSTRLARQRHQPAELLRKAMSRSTERRRRAKRGRRSSMTS